MFSKYIEDICFFEVNTKYISSSELKISEFSRVCSIRFFWNSICPWFSFTSLGLDHVRVLVCRSCVYTMYSEPSSSCLKSISPQHRSWVSFPVLIPNCRVHISYIVYVIDLGVERSKTCFSYMVSMFSSEISSTALGLFPFPMDFSCFDLAARIYHDIGGTDCHYEELVAVRIQILFTILLTYRQ